MFLNRVTIVGNLTSDPTKKALPSGSIITNFNIATNRVWTDKEGKERDEADFHSVVVFGRLAENCAKYLAKGGQALVEGRLQTRSWDGADGKKNYRTEIVAENVQFGALPVKVEPDQPTREIQYPQDDINPDDIPF